MTMRMLLTLGLALMGTSSVLADDEKGDPVPANLLGTYRIVAGQDNGQTVPSKKLEGIKVRITPGVIATTDEDGEELYVVKFNLNTDASPWKIAMTMSGGPHGERGTEAKGILDIDGDTVRLAYAVEGGQVPASFQTKMGKKQNMFVMKKIADENDR